jgi:glycosyltransferase involved in cell wall biosynthesis
MAEAGPKNAAAPPCRWRFWRRDRTAQAGHDAGGVAVGPVAALPQQPTTDTGAPVGSDAALPQQPTAETGAPVGSDPAPVEQQDAVAEHKAMFDLLVFTAARSLAASGDHRILLAAEPRPEARPDPRHMRIALCGNMANNAYTMARALRRLGYHADALISEAFFDFFVMSRPAWEELEIECRSYEDALAKLPDWQPPPFVRCCGYDQVFGMPFLAGPDGAARAAAMYRERFRIEPAPDIALLLAQVMSHWSYIAALADYDVAVFMAGPMMLAPFCPIPFAFYPVGGDRVLAPFEETLPGFLTRAGYRRSSAVFMSAPHFREWYDRLGVTERCVLSDYFIDTDIYRSGDEPDLRQAWHEQIGGETFIVSTCRQSWRDKGNDRLIRAFARLASEHPGLRLVFTEWGEHVVRSKELAAALRISDRLLWLPLATKPITARRQRAADIIVDQLVMASFGTCIMESMAAAKPVIARAAATDMQAEGYEPPPVVAAGNDDEVAAALMLCLDPEFRLRRGEAGRQWMLRCCSHETKAARFAEQLADVVGRARTS